MSSLFPTLEWPCTEIVSEHENFHRPRRVQNGGRVKFGFVKWGMRPRKFRRPRHAQEAERSTGNLGPVGKFIMQNGGRVKFGFMKRGMRPRKFRRPRHDQEAEKSTGNLGPVGKFIMQNGGRVKFSFVWRGTRARKFQRPRHDQEAERSTGNLGPVSKFIIGLRIVDFPLLVPDETKLEEKTITNKFENR